MTSCKSHGSRAGIACLMTLIAVADRTGTWVGVMVASGTLGIVFGRVVMGILTAHMGWRHSVSGITLICSVSLTASLALLLGTTARRPGLSHAS